MRFVTRQQWGAKPPTKVTRFTPTYGTTVHYEGPQLGTFPHTSCATKVRGIQSFHMGPQRGWADIAYTAIVCPHSYTFEGRWIGARTAANGTNDGNDSAYAVCLLIGEGDPLPDEMLAELVDVIDHLDVYGAAGPAINGHRDWKPTACPGQPAYQQLPAVRAAIAQRRNQTPPTQQPEDDMPQPTTIVDALVAPDGKGVWLLQYDGGVITKNGAPFFGAYPGLPPEQRKGHRNFVAIEPFQGGYACVATDGAIYRFPAKRAA